MSDLDKLRAPIPSNQLDRLKAIAAKDGGSATPSATAVSAPRPAGVLQPLTHELIIDVLDGMESEYELDEDGDPIGQWDNGLFYFLILSSGLSDAIFQVHGRWEESLPSERFGEAAIFANEWNSSEGLPMAFARLEEEDDTVGIYAETNVDFGSGLTLEQLTITIENGIGMALALFDAAQEMFADDPEDDDAERGEAAVEDGSIEP